MIREIKKKAGKKTYKNLTVDKMRGLIVDWEGKDSDAAKEYEKVVAISKVQAGPYAYVKKWFLDRYVHPRDNKKQEAIKNVSLLLQG